MFPFCSLSEILEGGYSSLARVGGKMGVTLGHLWIFMPEERPQGLQRHAAHGQATGEGMSWVVEPKFVDPCPLQHAVE
jgi:hypothetical protein